ncbi:uncharacterized protein BYT42DRAFT_553581 [Radiomyces spectabilis]|uniref:uncharacterized protein n=1 Tax=Radiomyces spectabilis TaxID=64574 RepID=UPI0022202808|nr:uncharacterized protein BYT42DRAFT_553581 [Radiomyces spectabilis]KAI8394160.1 hypothetical protein BYT42DRAFT_553581 [Radiomyces spectabilis]
MTAAVSWQKEMSSFFQGIGLIETSKCFTTELLVLSRHELARLPTELEKLVDKLLQSLEQHVEAKETSLDAPEGTNVPGLLYKKRKRSETETEEKVLEEDAKDRVHQFDSEQVQIRGTNADVNQRIQTYIQAKQNEVDASNRTEFLNRHDPSGEDVTCARTDAREINRNIQMKFDIANNEDEPLARSLLSSNEHVRYGKSDKAPEEGTEERLRNLQEHLNIKFERGATPPFSVFERIKILEDILVEIERQYPTWAAVHFNQPHRKFPPPPPLTLITRTTSSTSDSISTSAEPKPSAIIDNPSYTATQMMSPATTSQPRTRINTTGRANSSLTRAVIEQLNRQQQVSLRQSSE